MYLDHFRLDQDPFSIAPDPSFLYLSESHNEALAHLMYGFTHGGFVLVTGEVGTGKTTLLRNLVKHTPDELDVAFILNPRLTVKELLETTCDELGIVHDKAATQTVKQFIDLLNLRLLKVHREGRSTVIIIDEAQNLSPAVLEQIRLLTNLETDEKKLLRIILIGQPELDDMLARPELRQLAQRITARYHLRELNAEDTSAYVAHRITKAGGDPNIFPPAARRALYRSTKGIPRLINVVADRALLGAYSQGAYQVTPALVKQAAAEIGGNRKRRSYYPWVAASVVLASLTAMLWAWLAFAPENTAEAQPAQTSAPAEPAEAATPPAIAATDPQPPPTPSPTVKQAPEVAAEPEPIQTATPPSIQPVNRPNGSSYLTHRQAFADLFELWNLSYPVTGSAVPCDFAPQNGLSCTSHRSTWREVARINLPVVLELRDDEPLPFYAALLEMQDEQITLSIGSEVIETSKQALRGLWTGRFTVAWPTPQHYRGSVKEGDDHASVATLRAALARALGQPVNGIRLQRFDAELTDAVEAFQTQEGLIADGIASPITWAYLFEPTSADHPTLSGGF